MHRPYVGLAWVLLQQACSPGRPVPALSGRPVTPAQAEALFFAFTPGRLTLEPPPGTVCLLATADDGQLLKDAPSLLLDTLARANSGVAAVAYDKCVAFGLRVTGPVYTVTVGPPAPGDSGQEVRIDIVRDSFPPGMAKASTLPGPPYYIVTLSHNGSAWLAESIRQESSPF